MAIAVLCACGKETKVKDELAGKRIKCPACQSALTIPGASEDVAASVPPSPARRPALQQEEEEDAPPRRQASKDGAKKSNTLLFAAIGGGVLLLGCCCLGVGIGGFFLFFSPSKENSVASSGTEGS